MILTINAPVEHQEQCHRILLDFIKGWPNWPVSTRRKMPAVNDAGDIWLCWRTKTGWHIEFVSE